MWNSPWRLGISDRMPWPLAAFWELMLFIPFTVCCWCLLCRFCFLYASNSLLCLYWPLPVLPGCNKCTYWKLHCPPLFFFHFRCCHSDPDEWWHKKLLSPQFGSYLSFLRQMWSNKSRDGHLCISTFLLTMLMVGSLKLIFSSFFSRIRSFMTCYTCKWSQLWVLLLLNTYN